MPPPSRPTSSRATLGLKFALLVLAIFSFAAAALLLIQRTQRQSMADLLESETRERAAMLGHVIDLLGQSVRDFAQDYAQWDDMVQFVQQPRRQWAAINLDASLENFKVSAAWVLRADGSLVYATSGENGAPRPPLPLTAAALRPLLQAAEARAVYVQYPGRLAELWLAPVQPSDDAKHETTPRGWLLAERTWDAAHLTLLGNLLQCEVTLAPPGAPLPATGPTQVSLRRALPGADGQSVADLVYTIRSLELEIAGRHHRTQFWLFVLTCVVGGLVALIFLHRWVLRPLRAIGESLTQAQPGPILALAAQRDELGRVAQLVRSSFDQRAALESMLNERGRLGRELHDGVIQTVYAAGMNLTGARTLLRRDPAQAERILDDTHAELNTTIRDLRSFIAGLEPEPATQRSFRDAVQSIVALMQGVRPLACALDLDEPLAAKLRGSERLHLLQIVREAISNCVRHSEARELQISLRAEAEGAVLQITDDGAGLDPLVPGERGHGLANLAARARELGGTFQLESQPGQGLQVRVVFPQPA